MKTVSYYECEICGERFEYKDDCKAHEFRHSLENLFASGAKFYDLNGNPITIDSFKNEIDFTDSVYGIVCPSVEVASDIKEIWDNIGSANPFDEIEISAAPCRVMYDEDNCNWFNVDEVLARIKKQFGEE